MDFVPAVIKPVVFREPYIPPGANEAERRRRLRLWNFFNKSDDFWPIREWPMWAQRLALAFHKLYTQRYELFYFFAVNGLPPDLCEEWVLATDAANEGRGHHTLFSDGYNDAARAHVHSMVPQYRAGAMTDRRGARMFDMVLGQPVYHKLP